MKLGGEPVAKSKTADILILDFSSGSIFIGNLYVKEVFKGTSTFNKGDVN